MTEAIVPPAAPAPIFPRLYDEAERARWRMEDIPWQAIDRAHGSAELVELVRDIAASEATTFSATQRFLTEFADDVDFTNWVSIWFYEETKHPQALLRWLELFGERPGDDFMRRARVTAPFLKSRMATLVMNVISEMVASARYMNLHERCGEPVLAAIAGKLAGDEARHAASFFSFARKRLDASATPDVERRDALKVLYMWANEAEQVRHPVNLFRQGGAAGLEAARSRVVRMIGYLVDEPLRSIEDVFCRLKTIEA